MAKKEDDYVFYWEDEKKFKKLEKMKKESKKKMVFEDDVDSFEFAFDIPNISQADSGMHSVVMPIEFVDKGTHFVVTAKLPGFEEKDIDVNIYHNVLQITASKKEQSINKDKRFVSKRSSSASITKSFSLPNGLLPDKAFAKMEKGILTIVIPKYSENSEPKKKKRQWFG